MTAPRWLRIAALLLLFSFLTTSLGVYHYRQGALTLEGNDLYSPSAVEVVDRPQHAVEKLTAAHSSGRVFAAIDEEGNGGNVRSLTTVGIPDAALPLYEGRQPTERDDRVALVGSRVPLRAVAEYEFDGARYPVIGRLGTAEKSRVDDQVLIVDERLSEIGADRRVVVDSGAAAGLYRSQIADGWAVPLAAKTNRRTDIDYVSPILLGFGLSVTVLGFALTGAVAGASSRTAAEVAVLVGTLRRRVVIRGVTRLLLLAAPLVAAGIGARIAFTTEPTRWWPIAGVAVLQLVVAAIGYVIGVRRREPKERSWK